MSLRLTKTELDALTPAERKTYFALNEDGQITFARKYRGQTDAEALQNVSSYSVVQLREESMMKQIGMYGFYITLVLSLMAGVTLAMESPWFIPFVLAASLNGLFIVMWIAGIIETRLIELKLAIVGKEGSAH